MIKKILFGMLIIGVCQSLFGALTISPTSRSFPKEGGGASILTSGTDPWTATTDANWITITPYTNGAAGEFVIYVVDANTTADPRQATISVNSELHTVTQSGYIPTLTPTSVTKSTDGGSFSFTVSIEAGMAWTASTEDSWLTIGSASGEGPGAVDYTVAPYSGLGTRTGSIQIGSSAFTVSQIGKDVEIAPYSVYKNHEPDVIEIGVSALAETIWPVSTLESWISIVDSGSGQGDSTVTVGLSSNPSYLERTGFVQIGTANFEIRQQGNSLSALNLTPLEKNAEPRGESVDVSVFATPDMPWTATSFEPWIQLANSEGIGDGSISYDALANPTLDSRSGILRINAPYIPPLVDLTTSLQAMFIEGDSFDYSGWRRHRTGPDGPFTGSDYWTLQGSPIVTNVDAATVFIKLSVTNLDTVHRLFGIYAHGKNIGLYVNADNKLVFQANEEKLISSFAITNNQVYCIALTADVDGSIQIFAAEGSSPASLVASANFTEPPFPFTQGVAAELVKIGASDQPSSGLLNQAEIANFRLYSRVLRDNDIDSLFLATPQEPYGNLAVSSLAPVAGHDLRGSAARTTGSPTFNLNSAFELKPVTNIAVGDHGTYPVSDDEQQYSHYTSYGNKYSDFQEILYIDFKSDGNHTEYDSRALELNVNSTITNWDSEERTVLILLIRVKESLNNGSTRSLFYTHRQLKPTLERGVFSHSSNFIRLVNPEVNSVLIEASGLLVYDDNGGYGNVTPPVTTRSVAVDLEPLSLSKVANQSGLYHSLRETSGRFGDSQGAIYDLEQGHFQQLSHNKLFTDKDSTHTFWIRLDQLPATRALLFRRSCLPLAETYEAWITSEGNIELYSEPIRYSPTSMTPVNKTLVDNFATDMGTDQWYMLAFSGKSGGAFGVHVDGKEVGLTNNFGTISYGTMGATNNIPAAFLLGGWSGSASQLDFYDGALSSSEVKTLYEEQKPTFVEHVITQGATTPTLSKSSEWIEPSGGTASTQLTAAEFSNWTVSSSDSWLLINTASSGSGSTTVEVFAAANPSIQNRSAVVTIGGLEFEVSQKGQPASVSSRSNLFSADGGSTYIDVMASEDASWFASSNDAWLTVVLGQTGNGSGAVFLVANPYAQMTQSRTTTVTVGDSVLYFSQRGYDLSINPSVAQVGSNASTGDISVVAPIGASWDILTSEPWISLPNGNTGLSSDTIIYSVAQNTSGETRTGKIIIAGEVFTITQTPSLLINVTPTTGGNISGGGDYSLNEIATLNAVADTGFSFSHWEGDVTGFDSLLNLVVESDLDISAVFIPEGAASAFKTAGQSTVLADPNSYNLFKENQLRSMAIGSPFLEVDPLTNKLTVGFGLSQTDNLSEWNDVVLQTSETFIRNGNIEIELTVDADAKFYQIISE